MHQIHEEPENKLLCPDCGSKNVVIDEEHEVSNTKKEKLKQYHCKDCNAMFIPAALIKPANETMDKWAKNVRMNEGNNQNKSWKEKTTEFILIKKIK